MLAPYLPAAHIQRVAHVADWQAALRLCAAPLLAGGFIAPAYVDAIIATHEKIGPYYVLAPQMALAHARPEDGALRQGLALRSPNCWTTPLPSPPSAPRGMRKPSPRLPRASDSLN